MPVAELPAPPTLERLGVLTDQREVPTV
ncbi:MAG: hypothetical protein JWN22_1257, partial [Nocardioides sp.]|nr:hypothetical protein [Nocardioides sp.]